MSTTPTPKSTRYAIVAPSGAHPMDCAAVRLA